MRLRFRKNNKGVAIELALVAIVLMVSFCSVLISVVCLHRMTEVNIDGKAAYDVACEQVGEDFIAAVKAGQAEGFSVQQFVVNGKETEQQDLPVAEVDVGGAVGEEEYLMTLYDAAQEKVLLKVGVKMQGGNCVLTKWEK